MYHGSKVTEDYWHFLNPGDMVKNKDGHWQMRDNAASYAAGLGGAKIRKITSNFINGVCKIFVKFISKFTNQISSLVDFINLVHQNIQRICLR
jgi:hypothetical protein